MDTIQIVDTPTIQNYPDYGYLAHEKQIYLCYVPVFLAFGQSS
jgi:hypothetical protein